MTGFLTGTYRVVTKFLTGTCDEVCDGACDSVTELCGARPELIMTGPGAVTHYQPGPGSVLPSLSSPR